MTIHDPCALLSRLLAEPSETSWLEFKHNNNNPDTIGEYVSALANAAMMAGKDRAYLIFGIDNKSHIPIGTNVRLSDLRKGGENFINWLNRMIEPRLLIECMDFECDGVPLAIIVIEPTYDRPVRFAGTEWFRIGENKKKLCEFPEHERTLWLATGRRKFEDAIALSNQTVNDIFEKLETKVIFELKNVPVPSSTGEIIRHMVENRLLIDNMDGRYDITNLGAILLAREIATFPSISGKAVRVIKYIGRDKSKSEFEQKAYRGYAVGFSGLMRFLMQRLPSDEQYINGIRKQVPIYPETAIREMIANALIHQDFTITGTGPVIEIYENRMEITNAGNSLIELDRMLDERRSRNERLASTMRDFGLCEERGGGLDKSLLAIEKMHLPAPEFLASENSFCVVLHGPRAFNLMSKADKIRACYYHCVLRYVSRDFMSNSSLRERFSLENEDYQAVSTVISEAIKLGRIAPADTTQGRRNAKYIPYWAAAS